MRILDKYIIKNFVTPFLYCLVLFIFLYMIIDVFGHLDEILKRGIPLLILQEYYLSMIPLIIMHSAPVASLISTIYVISTMNKNDEIIAMRAAGISIGRILTPLVCLGLAISIAVFVVSEKILPSAIKNSQYIKDKYIENSDRVKGADKKSIYNIALYGKDDRLIFIKSYDSKNSIARDITILQQDKKGNVASKTDSREGKWTGSSWQFSDILIYNLDNDGMVAGNPSFFENKEFDMENPAELIAKGTNYEFMSFKDLRNYINNFSNISPHIIKRLRVDLHQKLSMPFTNMVLILIGAAFALKIKRRGKAAAMMGIGISVVIGFIYYAFMATFIALGKGSILPAFWAAHLANIIFGSVGIILIRN
ncbi:MAG: LptF/LptG family permease [Candidatus Omnitrophica bacterium]|nr:LptF/LptG family permease [Candidatus Omnitrophota bacterium]